MIKCEKKYELIEEIGKRFDRLTENEWDILIDHYENCPICVQKNEVVEEIIKFELRDVIREHFSDFEMTESFLL